MKNQMGYHIYIYKNEDSNVFRGCKGCVYLVEIRVEYKNAREYHSFSRCSSTATDTADHFGKVV